MPVASGVTEIRTARRFSISALAARAGVTRATVYAAERGDPVALETLIGIARALDVPLSQIAPDAAEAVKGVA